jgi:chromosome segregation ATPase
MTPDPTAAAAEKIKVVSATIECFMCRGPCAPEHCPNCNGRKVVDATTSLGKWIAEQAAEIAELRVKATRLDEIERAAQADADDLEKMRDGTKLNRWGLVQIIAYQQEDIAELRAKLAAAETDLDNERSAHKETMLRCDIYFDEIAALQSDLAHALGAP